jgi:hypothetical protein
MRRGSFKAISKFLGKKRANSKDSSSSKAESIPEETEEKEEKEKKEKKEEVAGTPAKTPALTQAKWRAIDEAFDSVSRFGGAQDPSDELVRGLSAGSIEGIDLRKISESVIISSVRAMLEAHKAAVPSTPALLKLAARRSPAEDWKGEMDKLSDLSYNVLKVHCSLLTHCSYHTHPLLGRSGFKLPPATHI